MDSTARATAWSVTINNPTKADEECINLARQKGWRVTGQIEKGDETGTEHYQLAVLTPQVRFSSLKKAFPRAHIEVARSKSALLSYVVKDETRVGELASADDKYPSQSRVWEWFSESFHIQDWTLREFQIRQQYSADVKSASANDRELPPKPDIKSMREQWTLDRWDEMIAEKIEEGYYVEMIGMHPQVRACVKKFGFSIWRREHKKIAAQKLTHTQTADRQTESEESEENISVDECITYGSSPSPSSAPSASPGSAFPPPAFSCSPPP